MLKIETADTNIQYRTYDPETLPAAFQALLIYSIITLVPVPQKSSSGLFDLPFSPHSMNWAPTSPKKAFILQKQHMHGRLGARGFSKL
jgi:hypothetical protein